MKPLDILLQRWRIQKASPWIPLGSRVLDVGCHQGEMFYLLSERIGPSLGIDPLVKARKVNENMLLPWKFSEPMPLAPASFDVITLLATFEHIDDKDSVARESYRLLESGGRIVITVPTRVVDVLLSILSTLRVLDGMSLDEHHGFNPDLTPQIFERQGFVLDAHKKFQLGLNHLYVFQKIG